MKTLRTNDVDSREQNGKPQHQEADPDKMTLDTCSTTSPLRSNSVALIMNHPSAEEKILARNEIDGEFDKSSSENVFIGPKSSETTNSSGILASARRWIELQRTKWQREMLTRAVEEQTKILLKETQKLEQIERSLEWQKQFDRNLNDNTTFQSLTHQNRCDDNEADGSSSVPNTETSSPLLYFGFARTFCGINLDDLQEDRQEDYIQEEPALTGLIDSHNKEGTSPSNPCDTNNNQSLYRYSIGAGEEDVFRVRSPRETAAGGISVQLEFLHDDDDDDHHHNAENDDHDSHAKNQKRKMRKVKDLIKVFEENGSNKVPFILTLEQMTYIAENGLPPNVLFSKWKRIYSLQRDGDSFHGAFMKRVQLEDRTLLVVQTTKNEIFGAYSNSRWKGHGPSGSACFYGSAQASLFSVNKDTNEINVYKWTGKNRFVQVCDMQHKLIAFGGGGKDGEFGLCIEDDFRVGSTGPCETFDNPQLCSQDQFDILNVECWGFVSGFC